MSVPARIILIAIFCLSACGRSSEPSDLRGGSFGHDYGGSFSRLTENDLAANDFDEMTVYLVAKPVGLTIKHHFLVVHLDQNRIYTLGLIAHDDLDFYQQQQNDADSILKTLRIKGRDRIITTLTTVKKYLERHPYRRKSVYGSALVATPLLGSPCQNISKGLFAIIKEQGQSREPV